MNEKFQEELLTTLRRDGAIGALKLLRSRTGMDLAQAKSVIDGLQSASISPELPGKLLDLAADYVLNSRSTEERVQFDIDSIGVWGEARWQAALTHARRLDECSYDLCDRARNDEFSTGEVQRRLSEACPGFSEKTYSRAFSSGMMASR